MYERIPLVEWVLFGGDSFGVALGMGFFELIDAVEFLFGVLRFFGVIRFFGATNPPTDKELVEGLAADLTQGWFSSWRMSTLKLVRQAMVI